MIKKIKSLAVLTSGGDAPGMNACIRSIVKTALFYNIQPYFINRGYWGLCHDEIRPAHYKDVGNIINQGGTILHSARYPEFDKLEVREKGVEVLQKRKIDAVVCLGGDGTFIGARNLSAMGINCIGVPCTIDNDLAYTDLTLGFNTALNTITYCGDNVRDTAHSHMQCSIIEVMGHHCGDLAIFAAFSLVPEIISTPENKIDENYIIDGVQQAFASGKNDVIVMVTENLYDTIKLAKRCELLTGIRTRATILGHIQRGGRPSALDRYLGSRFGVLAVQLLNEGLSSLCVGTKGVNIIHMDISRALKMSRKSRKNYFDILNIIK